MPARHKGIKSDVYLDRFWPHHVVIPWEKCCDKNYDPAHSRAHEMACAERRPFIRRNNRQYLGFRFKEPFQAAKMAQSSAEKRTTSLDRSKGSGWEKWRRKADRDEFSRY